MIHAQQHLILDQAQIEQKIKRMAYEMYEHNFEEQELVLAGIHEKGTRLATMLAEQLRSISPITVHLLTIRLNKVSPLDSPVVLEPATITIAGKVVIIVDDVLNTGKTLAYTLNSFLPQNPKKVEIATLVNRHHTLFPVASTYTGFSLATTLREHVEVVLQEQEVAAYLH
ncbi:phosphoribosyltransferase [Pontibacter sp. Tf4]|uniref:phosphoribosyltransferase family protein n=1 Tax=Pontibacter sp. Tf4 TaxID=2761620 RepID=UPI0016241272|nr:phosphoribosyltransferase family protein [Pontibacter sp. Tf4]MBB6611265.1 phosphoribosyltransferase [Pontibacter sp. Tf4]